ncbi:MAG TPA: hypothetical protein VHZ30_07630, partial [Verrucomicrobiae bacterium]|nr:hypothetical protein [Verrucomicrobiae bacterium]
MAEIVVAQDVIPYPRQLIKTEMLAEWKFTTDPAGWTAAHDCTINADGHALHIQSTGDDPYLFGPPINIDAPVTARILMRSSVGGNAQIFWATSDSPNFNESHSQHFHISGDNQLHIYTVNLDAEGTIRQLRLDPCEAPGDISVESIQLVRKALHPLEIQSIRAAGLAVSVRLKNYSPQPLAFTMDGRPFSIDGDTVADYSETVSNAVPFRTHELVIQPADVVSSGGAGKQPLTPLPAIRRRITIFNPDANINWAVLKSGDLVFRAARDGSGARVELGGKLVGVLSPLINFNQDTAPPKMLLTENHDKF